MNLRKGAIVFVDSLGWGDMPAAERTSRNATSHAIVGHTVRDIEWVPPHQRIVVTLDNYGRELRMTPHELELNGALNG